MAQTHPRSFAYDVPFQQIVILCIAAALTTMLCPKTAWSQANFTLGTMAQGTMALGTMAQGTGQATTAVNGPDVAEWHYGFDLFQMLLEERGLTVQDNLNKAYARPRQSVIVLIGQLPKWFSRTDWNRLVEFIRDGGAVLVATDGPASIPNFGKFVRGPVSSQNPIIQYRGFLDCLQLQVDEVAAIQLPRASRLVTNRAGWFEPDAFGWLSWQPLVRYPLDCEPANARGKALLAVGRVLVADGSGVVFASGDASLFSNGMMWHGDNAVAAIHVCETLCGPGRTNMVFIADQVVLETYRNRPELKAQSAPPPNLDDVELPEPELDRALRLANAVAQEIESSNVLNEALAQQPRNIPLVRYFRFVLIAIGALLAFWLLRFLLVNRLPRAIHLVPRPMQAAYQMRARAGLRGGDFRNPAGYLAREFCFELTSSTRSPDWQQYCLGKLSSPDSGLSAEMKDDLSRIVDLASRGCHNSMTRFEFQQLGRTIGRLRGKLSNASAPVGI